MQTINPYLFIIIGLGIRALRHCGGLTYSFIVTEGERLTESLKNVNFQVSIAGSLKLKDFIEKNKHKQPNTILTEAEATELYSIMGEIEQMVYAEAQTKYILVASEKRYNIDNLLNFPENMFMPEVFLKLPILAQYDLGEGFICLAFSRATASAFHVLRATEAVLKELYFLKIKRGRDKLPTWGSMTDALKKRRDADQKLIERLDYIRLKHRNPTDHPDLIYNVEDAEDLLGLCIEVIGKISKILFG